jgi:hypothetical protein
LVETLIVKEEHVIIGKIYERIKARFHSFFVLLITVLIMRTCFFLVLRFKNFSYIIDNDDNNTPKNVTLAPIHTYLMGLEEFIVNITLLSYLYGVNGEMLS